MRNNFTSFIAWKKAAKESKCSVRLVTRAKTNDYYQARRGGFIVGFFNTGLKGGSLSSSKAGKTR